MPTPDGGQIAASNINAEFGRGGEMSIWHARNGYYGGLNGCSGKRPGAPGRSTNSGYAWSDWWGYHHTVSCSNYYSYVIENACDADIRVQRRWHEGTWIGEWWNWGGYTYHTSPQYNEQIDTWFDANVDWGYYWCWCYKRIYTNIRGYFTDCSGYANSGCNLYMTTIYSGEYIESQFLCY